MGSAMTNNVETKLTCLEKVLIPIDALKAYFLHCKRGVTGPIRCMLYLCIVFAYLANDYVDSVRSR